MGIPQPTSGWWDGNAFAGTTARSDMAALMHVWDALRMAFAMFWEIFWAPALGFAISGAVQAVVSKKEVTRLLPDASPTSLLKAVGLGAASSSCSYHAVAI